MTICSFFCRDMTICSESRPCWLIIYIKKKSYGKTAVLVRRVAPQDRHRKVRRRLSCMVHQSSPGTRKTRINLSLTPFLSLSGIMSLAALRIRSGIRWKKKTATIPRSSHPGRFHSATDPAARSADWTPAPSIILSPSSPPSYSGEEGIRCAGRTINA